MNPTVSIVLPTYNHAHYLPDSISSVLSQTYQDWELLVVDNSSTDSTNQVLATYTDPRIRLLTISNDGVIARSRNLGIREARGAWVAFLDSDDLWYPDKLRTCIERLRKGADLVCHGERWVGGDLPIRDVSYGPAGRASERNLVVRGNCLSTSAVVVRRDLLRSLGGFSEKVEYITAEDYELWIRISREGSQMAFIEQILGEFRRSSASASADIVRNVAAEIAVSEAHLHHLYSGIRFTIQKRQRRARAFYGAGRAFAAREQRGKALAWYWRALNTSPFIVRLYPAMVLLLTPKRAA